LTAPASRSTPIRMVARHRCDAAADDQCRRSFRRYRLGTRRTRPSKRIRNDEIDILVDLKGYTVGDRLAIMAQVPAGSGNVAGLSGTTGTALSTISSPTLSFVPAGADTPAPNKWCGCRTATATDRKRSIADPLPRSACGLPDAAWCSAVSTDFKITPDIFAAWMRLQRNFTGGISRTSRTFGTRINSC